MVIRDAIPEDEAEVVALWYSCELVAAYNDPGADFRFALCGGASAVLIAEDAAACIVASVMVGHDGHRGWLYYVASAPDRRGQGLGRMMIEAGEKWLRDRSVPKVQLMVRPSNAAVVPFYERLGYVETPRILLSKWLG